MKYAGWLLVIGMLATETLGGAKVPEVQFYPNVAAYIQTSISQFDQIPAERKQALRELAQSIQKRAAAGQPVNLTFICTHNSRRSQLSQVWAQTAAAYYGIAGVTAYSGGIEMTAFNPRAVAAVRRVGFRVDKTTEADNPVYHVRFSDQAPPLTQFSKIYNQAPNPKKDFIAIMTCSHADKACPAVLGCSERVAILYEDPKAFDGTEREAAAYDERCRQISRELLYLFSQVK